ncbi:MAG: hypothetical protein JW744_02280 [Candidatus Diapherotrites archaeon]|uniref:Fibronectin type-III domain-containing protein n=1 Tax=Candidatus Iainarchaeum sp. TaxID=3101447 RepID=A0A938YQZ6_9ARCH|nr:hypothetical protein [Candidatus Diapherotrites archaeon]
MIKKFAFLLLFFLLISAGALGASCTIDSASPPEIFRTQSITVNISHSGFTSSPTGLTSIDCGGATYSDFTCTADTCTLTCGPYPIGGTYTIENLLELSNGTETEDCTGTAEVTVSNREPVAVLKADLHQGNPPLTVTFSGFCSDPDGNAIGICFLNYQDGTGEEIPAPYDFSKTHTYNTAGNYMPELTVKDDQDANNSDRARETITVVEPAAPTVNNRRPTGDTNIARPTVSFDVNDSGSGVDIASLKLFIDNELMETTSMTTTAFGSNYHVSWTFGGNLSNDHTVYVGLRVKDTLGNSTGDVNWNFTVDTEPPSSLSIRINSDDSYTNSTGVTLSLEASGASQCRFKNDDQDWGSWESYSSTSKSWTLRDSDGTRTVYLQCRDAAGNVSGEGSYSDYIVLDREGPNDPSNFDATYNSTYDEVELDWEKPSDRGSSGIGHYCLYSGRTDDYDDMDRITCNIEDDKTSYNDDAGNLDEGETYYYIIRAVDRAGNFGDRTDAESVVIGEAQDSSDTTAPNLTWEAPTNNSTVDGTITLRVEAYDNQSSIRFVKFYVDDEIIDTDTTAVDRKYSIDWDSASVEDGEHVLKAIAKNRSGNEDRDTTTKTITVTTENGATAIVNEERDSARESIDAADDAKELAAAMLEELRAVGVEPTSSLTGMLSDASTELYEAESLFDEEDYNAAKEKAEEAEALFNELLDSVSIGTHGSAQSYAFDKSQIETILLAGGLKNELVGECKELMGKVAVSRSLEIRKVVQDETTEYKAVVEITVKNNSDERQTMQLVEAIPKEVAESTEEIGSSNEFTVIESDPVVKWDMSLSAGQENKIKYYLKQSMTEEEADAFTEKQPMGAFKVPPMLLSGGTLLGEDMLQGPGIGAGFFALGDAINTIGWIMLIVVVIGVAIFLFSRLTGGKEETAFGLGSMQQERGMFSKVGGKLSGFGKAREEEHRPKWAYKG